MSRSAAASISTMALLSLATVQTTDRITGSLRTGLPSKHLILVDTVSILVVIVVQIYLYSATKKLDIGKQLVQERYVVSQRLR